MANAVRCRSPKAATTTRLISRSCWCRAGGTAVSGALTVGRPRAGRRALADAGGGGGAGGAHALSAMRRISARLCSRTRRGMPPTTARRRARAGGAGAGGEGAGWRWSRAATPASSPWRRRSARRWKRAGGLARARHRRGARGHRDARGRGARRRAARPRFLRDLAVRQPQAVGADRAAARRCRLRRASSSRSTTRSRARGPGNSARRSRCCRGICRMRRRSIFGRAVGRRTRA